MKAHTVTFQRLESELSGADTPIGAIRSVTVNHERGLLILICDDPLPTDIEGLTIPRQYNFTTQYDEDK